MSWCYMTLRRLKMCYICAQIRALNGKKHTKALDWQLLWIATHFKLGALPPIAAPVFVHIFSILHFFTFLHSAAPQLSVFIADPFGKRLSTVFHGFQQVKSFCLVLSHLQILQYYVVQFICNVLFYCPISGQGRW